MLISLVPLFVVNGSCPGSVLFLFEKKMGKRTFRILHCGDFRASPAHIRHPALKGKYLDSVYLDTTYLKYPSAVTLLMVVQNMRSRFKRMSSKHVHKNVNSSPTQIRELTRSSEQ